MKIMFKYFKDVESGIVRRVSNKTKKDKIRIKRFDRARKIEFDEETSKLAYTTSRWEVVTEEVYNKFVASTKPKTEVTKKATKKEEK